MVEIGAGTGILTRQLVDCGIDVTAIEPIDATRREFAAHLPNVQLQTDTAEHLPLGDAGADAVVAGQSFHWFEHGEALDEIAQVLRPGGHLVTVWNVTDEGPAWFDAYGAIIEQYAGDAPRHADLAWQRAVDGDGRYTLVDEWSVDHPVRTDRDGIVTRALSISFIAARPESVQVSIAAEIAEMLETFDPPFKFPYRSELQAWRLTDTA